MRRILRLLQSGPITLEPCSDKGSVMLVASDGRRIVVPALICRDMVSAGLVARTGSRLDILQAGRSRNIREENQVDGFLAQHSDIEMATIQTCSGRQNVAVNISESPLSRLSRLKTSTGSSFLEPRELRAGERLRGDFTKGQLQPRLGINWQDPASGGTPYSAGGKIDLKDTALSARQRVEKALATVGPEHSGVLVDICCFLKGLALVETERGWPVRSAKVVLKSALSALSRHYEPQRSAGSAKPGILHWGAPDYRPSLRQVAEES